MNAIYRTLGLSKQAFHQRLDHYLHQLDEQQQLIPVIQQIRNDHPSLSAREMYFMINPSCMGRDRFEAFCFENGFKVEVKRSFRRTTNSLGVTRFDNLVTGCEVNTINQVWVSDITYYELEGECYYLTFVMDLYSRYIVGYSVSRTLFTEDTTVPALRLALRQRTISSGLIFHSDGGGQYYSKQFLALTRLHGIRNSMGKNVWENPNAERINGTIKNGYVKHYNPQNYPDLIAKVKRAATNYNLRPHSMLKRKSPTTFEELINNSTKEKKNQKKKSYNNSYNYV